MLDAEERGLPSIDGVALGALAFLGARGKLAFVGIGIVAILAGSEGNWFLEVVLDVTTRAGHLGMLAEKRIFCFGVIESKAGDKRFPAAGGVARFARLFEFAAMRIAVTGRAGEEIHVLVTGLTAGRIRFMALLAGDFGVEPG